MQSDPIRAWRCDLKKNVLSLGEMIVLSARLATIEHVRQEMDAIASRRTAGTGGDGADGATETPELTRPVPDLLGEVFAKIEKSTPMPRMREAA
ncbi:MAG: hypothetical protein QM754_01470 [Tepidisphaeraceae bacterium]